MESCIFEGQVRHTRFVPTKHRFSYRLFYMYLDLDELPRLFAGRWFWSANRPALARFRRADHLGSADEPLADSVRALVAEATGKEPDGPIRLLTHLSYFGFCFNPVSFFYCFAADGHRLQAIVAEVNNTPWGERCCYVLPCGDPTAAAQRFQPKKIMHVSPFMPMGVDYDWSFSQPTAALTVYMANRLEGKRVFDASLTLKRKEISAVALAWVLLRYPFVTATVVCGIYWQAIRLWIKRCPFYPHPDKQAAATSN